MELKEIVVESKSSWGEPSSRAAGGTGGCDVSLAPTQTRSTEEVPVVGRQSVPDVRTAPDARPRVRRAPARRGPNGPGARFQGPQLRPDVFVGFRAGGAPRLKPAAGCQVTAPARWRLTDRGIAVVLVAGLMIVVAAVTVVGATAWRVSGEQYQPPSVSSR